MQKAILACALIVSLAMCAGLPTNDGDGTVKKSQRAPTDLRIPCEVAVIEQARSDMPRADTASVVELDDGRLLAVYHRYDQSRHAGGDMGVAHIYYAISKNGARTWGRQRKIFERASGDLNAVIPGLLKLPSGALLCNFSRTHSDDSSTMCVARSTDEGHTWTRMPPIFEKSPGQWIQGGASSMVLLKSGRIVVPVHGGTGSQFSQKNDAWCFYSDDEGKSWARSENKIALPKRGAMEGTVAQMQDGELVIALRTQLGGPYIGRSSDQGETWSKAVFSGLESSESGTCLRRVPGTDRLVLVLNNAKFVPSWHHFGDRTPLSLAVSDDHGKTWEILGHLLNDPKVEYTNLDCMFTSNGKVVVTFMYANPGWNRKRISLKSAVFEAAVLAP